MLKNIIKYTSVCLLLTSCTDFDWNQSHDTTLSGFDITSSDITVDLTDADVDMDAVHVIEWDKSHAADYTQVFYKVLFSSDGDFDNPDYSLEPALIGIDTKVELSNRTLNIIAEAAGIAQNSAGSLKWTVRATNGVASAMAESVHTLSVSRPAGFAYIPDAVDLVDDNGLVNMLKTVSPGVFEGYVYLKDGSYSVVDHNATSGHTYGISGASLVMDAGITPVKQGRIHHVTVDFNKASAYIASVEQVGLWYSGANDVIADMTPAENNTAMWSTTFLFESIDNDLRYKFRFTEEDGAGNKTERFYGYASAVSRPQTSSSPASYFYLIEENTPSQSSYTFSLNRTLHNNKNLSVTVDMRPEVENYTHTLSIR